MSERYHEFMNAHQRIERWLQRQGGVAPNCSSFAQMLKNTARHHPMLRRSQKRLLELNDLRNVIVHKAGGVATPIAEPTDAVVRELAGLADQLTSPPRLPSRVLHDVTVFSAAQPLSEAVSLMRENDFSQVPVADADVVVGVLTAGTVTRWLASQVRNELVSIVETPIGDVLSEQERSDHWEFLSAKADCGDALKRFIESQERGCPLEVLLLTDTGRQQLPLRGIVTLSDLGELTSCLVRRA